MLVRNKDKKAALKVKIKSEDIKYTMKRQGRKNVADWTLKEKRRMHDEMKAEVMNDQQKIKKRKGMTGKCKEEKLRTKYRE